VRNFWSSVITLAVTALALWALAAYLVGQLDVDPFPFLEHLKGK
jgi:hypothetical protein